MEGLKDQSGDVIERRRTRAPISISQIIWRWKTGIPDGKENSKAGFFSVLFNLCLPRRRWRSHPRRPTPDRL